MFCVYRHTLKNDGRVYIGQTNNTKDRWRCSGKKYKGSRHFYSAILKYGWDAFDHEVLFNGLSKEAADQLEEMLISIFDSTNPSKGFNLRHGGKSSTPSAETRARMSQAQSGEKHPNYNRKLPESHRRHISDGVKGEKNPFYGRHHTPEAIEKIKAKRAGQIHPMLGRHHADSAKEKMRTAKLATAITVICEETGISYQGIKEASRQTGIDKSSISRCCRGKQTKAGGFHWRYAECQ